MAAGSWILQMVGFYLLGENKENDGCFFFSFLPSFPKRNEVGRRDFNSSQSAVV